MGSAIKSIAAAVLASASLAAHGIATEWTMVDLGTLTGVNDMANAMALSDNGTVVGCIATTAGGTRAFVYSNGQMRDLAPEAPAGSSSCAYAVNNAGLIAGRIAGEVTIWKDGTTIRLGVQGAAAAMNDAGVVVGTITEGAFNAGGPTHAFMWVNGNMTLLPMDAAFAINERNQVLGTVNFKPVLYENGTARELPLPNAKSMNDAGVIVGGMNFAPGEPSPYYYDGMPHPVPSSPCCGFAVGINNANQIIGSVEGLHGFYAEGGAASTLDNLPGVRAAGWNHPEPNAINERGWIVGQGQHNGDIRAFLLFPKASSAPSAGPANPALRAAQRAVPLIRARAR